MIKAEIVGHSLSPQGDELISVLCTFPRIILAEVNTHRMLSKNTSSSRAIPFKKMVESVQNDPFVPTAWQRTHSGMQGSEYITEDVFINEAKSNWLVSRDNAIKSASYLNKTCQVTKQLCNRLLEPFMWTTMLITGSKEGWDNFFSLRCPVYESHKGIQYKSWKDYVKDSSVFVGIELKDYSQIERLQKNKGMAEIHMMDLAEKIYDEYQNSVPLQLKENQWHIPFEDKINELYPNLTLENKIKVSVGMAANTSYTIVGDGSIITLEKATRIHDKCKELSHSSVFEHCARAMSDEEYITNIKGTVITGYTDESELQIFVDNKDLLKSSQLGWCNNFKGFIPYRYLIDNKLKL